MQLAAISAAALHNTRESAFRERIEKGHPYWTPEYDDVCRAVEREMDNREEAQHEREQHEYYRAAVGQYMGTNEKLAKENRRLVEENARLKVELERANRPFENRDPRIKVYREATYYLYEVNGNTTGPFSTWREAYRAAEAVLNYPGNLQKRVDELKARLMRVMEARSAFNRLPLWKDIWENTR